MSAVQRSDSAAVATADPVTTVRPRGRFPRPDAAPPPRPPTGVVALLGALAWALTGRGLVNYDTLYALVWGRELAHGTRPDYDVAARPDAAPARDAARRRARAAQQRRRTAASTARPRRPSCSSARSSPSARSAGSSTASARAWFGPAAGALAAAIVLTRRPVLDFGARAYVDIPYVALVLGALLVETRRPRAGAPVLALLAVAGLLRPEAWLFSVAYLAWLWRAPRARARAARRARRSRRRCSGRCRDLVVTGDPLHSLPGTRDNAQTLQRITGPRTTCR